MTLDPATYLGILRVLAAVYQTFVDTLDAQDHKVCAGLCAVVEDGNQGSILEAQPGPWTSCYSHTCTIQFSKLSSNVQTADPDEMLIPFPALMLSCAILFCVEGSEETTIIRCPCFLLRVSQVSAHSQVTLSTMHVYGTANALHV